MFIPLSQLSVSSCDEESVWSDKLMDFHCPLFARKFPNSTALAIKDLTGDCKNKVDITACAR